MTDLERIRTFITFLEKRISEQASLVDILERAGDTLGGDMGSPDFWRGVLAEVKFIEKTAKAMLEGDR